MCKETFLRLPEEKRNRFLEAAWEEFTRVKFADVSINQIVRRAHEEAFISILPIRRICLPIWYPCPGSALPRDSTRR